jgi:hypothetical protein
MTKKYQSEALEALHETALGLHSIGQTLGKGDRGIEKKGRGQSGGVRKVSERDGRIGKPVGEGRKTAAWAFS